jgi:hypothetical protein
MLMLDKPARQMRPQSLLRLAQVMLFLVQHRTAMARDFLLPVLATSEARLSG